MVFFNPAFAADNLEDVVVVLLVVFVMSSPVQASPSKTTFSSMEPLSLESGRRRKSKKTLVGSPSASPSCPTSPPPSLSTARVPFVMGASTPTTTAKPHRERLVRPNGVDLSASNLSLGLASPPLPIVSAPSPSCVPTTRLNVPMKGNCAVHRGEAQAEWDADKECLICKTGKYGLVMDIDSIVCDNVLTTTKFDNLDTEGRLALWSQLTPHAVCVPLPIQGHITPMLKLAKLLHHRGFHVTVVVTDHNRRRLLRSQGPSSLAGTSSFRFRTIPDGLPPSDTCIGQDPASLCESTSRTCLVPFRNLLAELNSSANDVPPVSCVVFDGAMSFAIDAAEELGVPAVMFWTTSACGFLAYLHYRDLVDKGLAPLKDETFLTNGFLDTAIDWIPVMKNMRLRDMPSFARTTDPNDFMFNFISTEAQRARGASAVVLNTFHALERECLDALSSALPCPVFSIGSLELLLEQKQRSEDVGNVGSNLWMEDSECLHWLDSKEPNSVLYVSFGSIAVMTNEQLVEFAWGLANSNKPFLWVIRTGLLAADSAGLPPEFLTATRERGLLVSWCPQVEVLNHPAIGGFLTHCGWNSTLESLCGGVPVICWPVLAEQPTNCRYCCTEWGVGMEMDSDVKREGVEKLVIELMEAEKGKEMRKKAVEWKKVAREAGAHNGGTSQVNLEKLISQVLQPNEY